MKWVVVGEKDLGECLSIRGRLERREVKSGDGG